MPESRLSFPSGIEARRSTQVTLSSPLPRAGRAGAAAEAASQHQAAYLETPWIRGFISKLPFSVSKQAGVPDKEREPAGVRSSLVPCVSQF